MKNWVDGKTGLYITSYILQIRFVGILKFGLLDSLVCELSIFFGIIFLVVLPKNNLGSIYLIKSVS